MAEQLPLVPKEASTKEKVAMILAGTHRAPA